MLRSGPGGRCTEVHSNGQPPWVVAAPRGGFPDSTTAAVAGTAVLQRTGLLEQDVPGLDLLGGRTPCLLDYF